MAYIEVVAKLAQNLEEIRNVWTFHTVAPWTTQVAEEAATLVKDAYITHWLPGSTNGMRLYEVAARNVTQAGYPELTVWTGNESGGASVDPLPATMAVVLQLRSNTARPNKGRKFLPGNTEVSNAGGAVLGVRRNEAIAMGNAIVQGSALIAAPLIIPRRTGSGAVIAHNNVTIVGAAAEWAYLRGRGNRR